MGTKKKIKTKRGVGGFLLKAITKKIPNEMKMSSQEQQKLDPKT